MSMAIANQPACFVVMIFAGAIMFTKTNGSGHGGHGPWIQAPGGTLHETNIAPENRPLEKEIPIGNHHSQVLC